MNKHKGEQDAIYIGAYLLWATAGRLPFRVSDAADNHGIQFVDCWLGIRLE